MAARVVVCYTGGVGSQVIRLLAANPSGPQLAGVLVHSPEKEGRDVGELVGLPPLGIISTRDVEALVGLGADCVLWHGAAWEPEIIAKFLAAGTNVYSSIGGWYLPGQPEYELLSAACQTGNSSIVAGGNIPGLISDVLPLFTSGYSGLVTKIQAWQSDYVAAYPSQLQLEHFLGIGKPIDESADPDAPAPSDVDEMWLWGIRQSASIVGAGLGVPVTDVRVTRKEYAATPEDMVLSPTGLRVDKGTTAGVRWTFTAFTTGDFPFFEIVNEQTVRLGLGAGWRQTEDEPNWRVQVTGVPEITVTFNLSHGDGTAESPEPVSALNAARGVNFIPRLIEAPAGWRTVLDLAAPRATLVTPGSGS